MNREKTKREKIFSPREGRPTIEIWKVFHTDLAERERKEKYLYKVRKRKTKERRNTEQEVAGIIHSLPPCHKLVNSINSPIIRV